jgi:Hpt domain
MTRSSSIAGNEILDELRAAVDDADLEVILSVFEIDAEAQLSDLNDFATSGQHDAARRVAHRLAGLLAQFGAKDAAELAHRMAASSSNPGDIVAIAAIMSTCRTAVAEICACVADSAVATPVAPACQSVPKQAIGKPKTLPPQMAADVALKATMQYPTHRRRAEAVPSPDG